MHILRAIWSCPGNLNRECRIQTDSIFLTTETRGGLNERRSINTIHVYSVLKSTKTRMVSQKYKNYCPYLPVLVIYEV